jgi:replicative DNA helicase
MAKKLSDMITVPRLTDIDLEYGRIPPQATSIEEAVLGAILSEEDAIFQVIDLIKPQCFYKDAHQKIFQAMYDMFEAQEKIDILTVTEKLRKKKELEEVGGPLYITQLSGKISTAIHLPDHAKIILQKWIAREAIRISAGIQKKSFSEEEDIADVISSGMGEFSDVLDSVSTGHLEHIKTASNENIEVLRKVMAGEMDLQGIATMYKELDELCNGLQKSDLIIIASRPSMGKTALMVSLAKNIAVDQGIPVAIFSLEMSKRQIDLRFKVLISEVPSQKVFKGQLDPLDMEKIVNATKKINEAPIYINDTSNLTIVELRSAIRRLVMEVDIGVVFVDYLQLMTPVYKKGQSREQEVAEISRNLKLMAREFNIPLAVLCQVGRAAELTADQKPKLAHLRESGSQEADADQVWFVYRPFKAGIKEDTEGQSTYGKAEIIVAKHRNGPIGTANLGFVDKYIKFMNQDEMSDTQLLIPQDDLFKEQKYDNPF